MYAIYNVSVFTCKNQTIILTQSVVWIMSKTLNNHYQFFVMYVKSHTNQTKIIINLFEYLDLKNSNSK